MRESNFSKTAKTYNLNIKTNALSLFIPDSFRWSQTIDQTQMGVEINRYRQPTPIHRQPTMTDTQRPSTDKFPEAHLTDITDQITDPLRIHRTTIEDTRLLFLRTNYTQPSLNIDLYN